MERVETWLARALCKFVGIPRKVVDDRLQRDAEIEAEKREDIQKAAELLRKEEQ